MRALPLAFAVLSALAPAWGGAVDATPVRFAKPQSDYLLNCGGCHGERGVSNSKLVPDLHDQVGYFLNTVEGREYLVRLPNVAFSTLSNRELAAVLNFTVFQFGGSSVPVKAEPYTPSEVARLRKHVLNEVSLIDYRKHLTDTLIAEHHASQGLRVYGADSY